MQVSISNLISPIIFKVAVLVLCSLQFFPLFFFLVQVSISNLISPIIFKVAVLVLCSLQFFPLFFFLVQVSISNLISPIIFKVSLLVLCSLQFFPLFQADLQHRWYQIWCYHCLRWCLSANYYFHQWRFLYLYSILFYSLHWQLHFRFSTVQVDQSLDLSSMHFV